MEVSTVFEWLEQAATGGLDVLRALSNGVSDLFVTQAGESGIQITFLGILTIAGVGAPLAWKFIKYIISLFKKVQPN